MRVRAEWNERRCVMLLIRSGMSVYEQIASRTRARRHRKMLNDDKLDEQVESVGPDDDDDDDRASVVLQVRARCSQRWLRSKLSLLVLEHVTASESLLGTSPSPDWLLVSLDKLFHLRT